MAKLLENSPLQGMRGSLGGLVFRYVHGETIVSTPPERRRHREQTEMQRRTRVKFRHASHYARRAMCDPLMRAHYKKQAAELGLNNAWTAAITDYLRNTPSPVFYS